MTKKQKRPGFELAEQIVEAGTRSSLELSVPDLYVHNNLSIPVHVVHGKADGPVLFISAAVHGDEIVGVEIIRRVLASKQLNRIRGTVVAVPIVNIFGFLNQSRYLPDRRDLNRCFPGSTRGSIAGRLANLFLNQVVARCTHGIDLHTAAINRENLPQIRADTSDPEVLAMAKAFGLPVIVSSELIEGSLRASASEAGVKVLVYEASEALRFDEQSIRAGVSGVFKVMRSLGMLSASRSSSRSLKQEPVVSSNSRWVRAPQSGIHRSITRLGKAVKKGDELGYIADPLGGNQVVVEANTGGILIGRSTNPLVTEGEALFHIASFEVASDIVAERIDQVEEILDNPDVAVLEDEPPIAE